MTRRSILTAMATLLIGSHSLIAQQAPVDIQPQKPTANDNVQIRFWPQRTALPDTVSAYYLNFSSSNYYEMPQRLKMEKNNDHWQVSFKLPFYANFSSFTISDFKNEWIQQPTDSTHYELFVYQDGRLKEGNYLGKGYSISVQNRKSPDMERQQQVYFKKELELFPTNYEAQLRVLAYEMKKGDEIQQRQAHQQALQVIDKKFRSNPTDGGNLNKVTMGYLIIGENQRLDSIRQVVINEFPNSELGITNQLNKLFKSTDSVHVVQGINDLFKNKNKTNEKAFQSAYAYLFEYYVRKKDASQAAHYLSLIKEKETNPYTWRSYSEYASLLLEHQLLLDSAYVLNKLVLDHIQEFPVTLVRYFPETGYLVAHDDQKTEKTAKAKATILATQGLIQYYRDRKDVAWQILAQAYPKLDDVPLLKKIADLYKQESNYKEQTAVLREAFKQTPYNQDILKQLAESLVNQGFGNNQIIIYQEQLLQEWKTDYFSELDKKVIDNKAFPQELSIVDLQGRALTAADLQGKVVVIDLWATWCKPCLASFPYVQKVYEKYKNDSSILFVILNTGSGNSLEDTQKWTSQNQQYNFPVYYNKDKKLNAKLEVTSIPTSFILSPTGQIVFKKVGSEGEKIRVELDAMIDYVKAQHKKQE
ncbi:TlpA family protein disulfide reductase [Sphingobacterium tabacisoli]|uniref:TlpA family protein disulfide reductase n=1 Tax=Sphingobacterium tabacisoli TaxID=2044855 RepID=A0ABW5L0N9_9SPHI|nr:TlpA disulfide reductase family protein [Sphingobacterium tabacisoli]